jgi:hypothetical protein
MGRVHWDDAEELCFAQDPLRGRVGDCVVQVRAGQRIPHDVVWCPPSEKVFLRACGLVFRVSEPLGYWDGEPG